MLLIARARGLGPACVPTRQLVPLAGVPPLSMLVPVAGVSPLQFVPLAGVSIVPLAVRAHRGQFGSQARHLCNSF